MKNHRYLPGILAVCMLLGMLVGCDGPSGQSEPTTEPQQTTAPTEATLPPLEGTMELNSAADLQAMASNPVKTYVLKQDIDMGGAEWTGIAGFRSVFEGNGHTISNVTIVAADGAADLGFFADITEEGEVKDLNLVNVTIDASKSSAKNIGTVAGTVLGKVTNCTATGIITDTREDAMSVGALVGTAAAGATVEGGTSISVTDDAGVCTTEGLAADVKLFVADHENVKRGFVGTATGATVTGLWRDRFYSSERNPESIKERQQIAVDYLYKTGSVAWTVPETIKIHGATETSVHNQVFEPGVVYYGIPYTIRNGSLERFVYCMDENMQFADWAMDEFRDVRTEVQGTGFTSYMGTDCVGAAGLGWARISPIDPMFGGAFPSHTWNMLPLKGVQKKYGVFPVGQKKGDTFDGDDAAYEVEGLYENSTQAIYDLNGEAVLLEAYAMSRKADVMIVKLGQDGIGTRHLRTLAVDPTVIRNADGSVDLEQSYMITHEQGDGLFNCKYAGAKSSWRLYYRYTFQTLLYGSTKETNAERMLEAGCSGVYVPITIRALREEMDCTSKVNVYPAMGTSEITTPESGSYSANFRLISSRVIIKDQAGNVVKDETYFLDSRDNFENKVSCALLHMDVCKGLEAGTYTFSIIATLSDGSVHTVVENVAYQQK